MSHRTTATRVSLALTLYLGFASLAGAEAVVSQTVELRAGWNAVYLEVQPPSDDPDDTTQAASPAAVFANLPVESVWTFFAPTSSVQFIQSPDEENWNRATWGAWFAAEDKAFLSNLHAIHGNRAYLIKLAEGQSASWTVSGRPDVSALRWQADSFNLTGLRVDPDHPPTFAEYFAPSRAHTGQALYRLDAATGQWQFVDDPADLAVAAGEAYWIYCRGASDYQGPVAPAVPRDGLDFGSVLTEQTLTVSNPAAVAHTVQLRLRDADVVLAYREYDPISGYYQWPDLAALPVTDIEPARQRNIRLAVRREEMGSGVSESVLEILSDAGTRLLVPVRVENAD